MKGILKSVRTTYVYIWVTKNTYDVLLIMAMTATQTAEIRTEFKAFRTLMEFFFIERS